MNNTLVYLQNVIENRARRSVLPFFIIGTFHLFRIVDSPRWLIFISPKLNDVFIKVNFHEKNILLSRGSLWTLDEGWVFVRSDKRGAAALFIWVPTELVHRFCVLFNLNNVNLGGIKAAFVEAKKLRVGKAKKAALWVRIKKQVRKGKFPPTRKIPYVRRERERYFLINKSLPSFCLRKNT